jgi:hypothetical protein
VEKTTQQGALFSVRLIKCYLGDQIKTDEMGRACSTYRGKETCIQGFGGENLREGSGVDGGIILKCIFEKWDGSMG